MESTNPQIAIVRRENERRPSADNTMPTIATGIDM